MDTKRTPVILKPEDSYKTTPEMDARFSAWIRQARELFGSFLYCAPGWRSTSSGWVALYGPEEPRFAWKPYARLKLWGNGVEILAKFKRDLPAWSSFVGYEEKGLEAKVRERMDTAARKVNIAAGRPAPS
ncbi:MAG: hypothetical protein ACF8XB_09100 [Planctomycetota bacterium JB042]